MKSFKVLLGLVLLVAMLSGMSFAQTILTNTTLSAAVADSNTRSVSVTSATNITALSTFIYVDRELIDVRAVSGTILSVVRGVGGTFAAAHASSAPVFVIPAALSTLFRIIPQGACTRTNEIALPRIEPVSGTVSDCLGGQWVNGDAVQVNRLLNSTLRLPDPGATALTALQTAGTVGVITEEQCIELDVPYSMLITGLGILNGTTVATDKRIAILRDSGGKVLATSALAGITTATASVYQPHNFTAKYYAVGPARYFGCVQINGTTDTTRHAITAVNDNVLAGKLTGQTFGTVVAATMPTTFTTALGPYLSIY